MRANPLVLKYWSDTGKLDAGGKGSLQISRLVFNRGAFKIPRAKNFTPPF